MNRISIFIAVPFMFALLAKIKFRRVPDFSSLRFCISASAPLPEKINRQFYQQFGIYIRQLYGSTETGTISLNLSLDIQRCLESVGTPLAGVEVKLFDEHGDRALAGAVGELAIRTPGAAIAYDNGESLDNQAFRDGYFFSGDFGKHDENGLLYLLGRKKNLINKGGYKVNPREIEELLERHPHVEEALVIGVPTAYGDERIKALVVSHGCCTEQDLIEHCRGKIAAFKIPSIIEFRESVPLGPTGKARRLAV
jgi:long-chain acyl-CoA synthetase